MVPQNPATHARKLKLRWFVTLSTLPLLGVVTAFGIMPQSAFNMDTGKQITEELVLPELPKTADSNAAFWRNDRMQRGDTVAELLQRLNVDDPAASNYLRTNKAAESFRRLAIGRDVQAETTATGSLLALRYLNSNGNEIVIEKSGNSFRTSTLPLQTEKRLFIRTGEITSTLYEATDAAGLPDPVANQMAEIFGGDVDFHRDIHKGDKFSVIYEVTYSNGRPVRSGNILAAEFVNNGRSYRALYYQTGNNHGSYFAPDGKSMHKAFLRSPIEYSRISSGFSLGRLHPILNKMRAHKGVDYAAPIGTKVKATADGVVTFVGKQGGYGNVIMLSHQGVYTTVYGHLSHFAPGLHRGQRVAQGEIIGNVGMTGLATGPHLHYEFKINGAQRDPLRVALPDAKPISEQQKAAFQEATLEMKNRLNMLRDTNLAKLD
ncbi:MAG TPA: M23 family metallopeptidase [Gallionellaceae bacterium]